MATFDLGQAVEPLSYDFTTGSSGWDDACGPGKGSIPDPTRKQIVAFQNAITAALGMSPGASQEKVREALAALDNDAQEHLADAMLDALAALCSGHPSRDELGALSVRALSAFSGFIHGQLAQANPT